MEENYILNGEAHGGVAQTLIANNCDPGCLKPWVGKDGRSYITVNRGGKAVNLVTNSPATLRKDEWIELDRAVITVAKQRLKAWGDLVSAGLTFTVPDGLGVTVLQHQTMSDIGPATTSMDGLRRGERDRPLFDLTSIPLPITHKDFSFSLRELMTSRRNGVGLDMSGVEQATRNVAEQIEKLVLGTVTGTTYGGGTIYGYSNYPSRITRSITDPTEVGWTPATTVADVLAMKQDSIDAKHYGPWFLYFSNDWSRYLDDDYSATYPGVTLRDRLNRIEGIQGGVRTLDFLSSYEILLVQATSNVVQAITGMRLQTLQWESNGGMELNFKVMCVMLPRLRKDYNGNTGIVHGT